MSIGAASDRTATGAVNTSGDGDLIKQLRLNCPGPGVSYGGRNGTIGTDVSGGQHHRVVWMHGVWSAVKNRLLLL